MTDKTKFDALLPETAEALDYNANMQLLEEAIHEISRPMRWGGDGWVTSLEACFKPKSEEDFLRMFQKNGEGLGGMIGFHDDAEGLRCESAAKKAGIQWDFKDYKMRFGLGTLNKTISEAITLSRALKVPMPDWLQNLEA